jgi:hypothetical protein
MAKRAKQPESNAGHATGKIRTRLADLVRSVRHDAERVSDPKAQALFETTAEVLDGLIRAYDHAEQKSEPAWT